MSSALPPAELKSFARVAARLLVDPPARSSGARAMRGRAGAGLEYLDHRDYAAGDDLRHVDWRQSARRGHTIVRRFQLEASSDWMLCLDASSSMADARSGKWRLAVDCAAALGYALLDMGHRVGLLAFGDDIVALCPPGRGFAHYPRLLRTLERQLPAARGARSHLGACVPRLTGSPCAFVLGDFLAADAMRRDLGALLARCTEVQALRIASGHDRRLVVNGHVTLLDRETGERLDTIAGAALERRAAEATLAAERELRQFCLACGIGYSSCDAASRLAQRPARAPARHPPHVIAFGAAPWLLGLGLVPLIWWLHRASGHGRLLAVPSLLPFRDAPSTGAAGTPARAADPAWMRRAAIAALLSLALAAPVLRHPAQRLVVWIDDSPAMGTREAGGRRLDLALAALHETLRGAPFGHIELRSLAAPGIRYALDGRDAAATPVVRAAPAIVPAPAALDPRAEHWLVTGGSDAALESWARSGFLARVIRVGRETENVALTSLGVRSRLSAPGVLNGSVSVLNAGERAARRTVTVRSGDAVLLRTALDLAPGAERRLGFTLPGRADAPGTPAMGIAAALSPADALAADDTLALAADALRPRRIALDAQCPAAVRRAALASSELALTPAGAPPDAVISCTADAEGSLPAPAAASAVPVLHLLPGPGSEVAGDARWRVDARGLLAGQRAPRAVALGGTLAPAAAGDEILLACPGGIVAVRRGQGLIDTVIAAGSTAPAAAAEFPLLLASLLELSFNEPLVGRIARATHEPALARIAPRPSATPTSATTSASSAALAASAAPGSASDLQPLAPWLLLPALLLLLWDLVASLRRGWLIARAGADA